MPVPPSPNVDLLLKLQESIDRAKAHREAQPVTETRTNEQTTESDYAYDAFEREQEAGNTERDRGGYYGRGFRDGYATALLDLRDMSTPPGQETADDHA